MTELRNTSIPTSYVEPPGWTRAISRQGDLVEIRFEAVSPEYFNPTKIRSGGRLRKRPKVHSKILDLSFILHGN
ncbi:hypothetical protein Y032_0007g3289 [Ancylostoma ceylanicum]|uniref:Uncharacterized protein n=1 Tax=Ancylostoma ceylanicum TaxID=53326 RepID=A0A016VPB4_9BILA|nr:hypothetical protein Y032_0007g3289 [Ancylostoma ceylanicum]